MLILAFFLLIIAVALPNVRISPAYFSEVVSTVFLFVLLILFIRVMNQAIGLDVRIYSGLFQVNSVSIFMDTFIFFIGFSLTIVLWIYLSVYFSKLNVSELVFALFLFGMILMFAFYCVLTGKSIAEIVCIVFDTSNSLIQSTMLEDDGYWIASPSDKSDTANNYYNGLNVNNTNLTLPAGYSASLACATKIALSLKSKSVATKIGTFGAITGLGVGTTTLGHMATQSNGITPSVTSQILRHKARHFGSPPVIDTKSTSTSESTVINKNNPFIKSVNESGDSGNAFTNILQWLYDHLPTSVQNDLLVRLPHSSDNLDGIFNALVLKHNFITYLIHFNMTLVVISLIMVAVLYELPRFKDTIRIRLAIKLYEWFMYYRTQLILLNGFGFIINLINIKMGIDFMYDNYLPSDIGTIYDLHNHKT